MLLGVAAAGVGGLLLARCPEWSEGELPWRDAEAGFAVEEGVAVRVLMLRLRNEISKCSRCSKARGLFLLLRRADDVVGVLTGTWLLDELA